MLTDDDLTRDLRAAFRSSTTDLTYAGPLPRPGRRAPWLAVPALTVAGAVAVSAVSLGGPHTAQRPVPSVVLGAGAATTPATSAGPHDPIHLAGLTLAYRRGSDDYAVTLDRPGRGGGAADLTATANPAGGVPDGAREVRFDGPVRAWVGTDPVSGDNAIYVKAPTRNSGRLFEISSPTWSLGELEHLLRTGTRD